MSASTIRKRFGLRAAPFAAAVEPALAITGLKPTAVREPGSGRAWTIVKLDTASGVSGYGEAPATPDPETVVARLKKVEGHLRGHDALSAVRVDESLKAAGVEAAARAAVNTALMDILGKTTKSSLTETLGGRTREKARAMAVVSGDSLDELKRGVAQAKAAGHLAFSVPLKMPEGPERGRAFYMQVREMMDALRDAAGADTDFVLDCAGQTTPGEGLSIADRLQDFHLLWLDEPAGDLSDQSLAEISARTVTPVGYGRDIVENGRFQDLLRQDAIDVLRPDIAKNGVTSIRKAAALAETYYVAVAPYHRGGPISTAAGIHIAASLPNSFIQEVPFPADPADRKMRSEIAGGWDEKPVEGFFALPTKPGLGIEVDDDAIAKYALNA